jgi:selenocysteine-specific elongation factor
MPQHLQEQCPNKKYLQFTLVDCPGHASLIKTVIGGAQIIDLMFLIVDINKVLMGET